MKDFNFGNKASNLGRFAHKHTVEVLTAVAVLLGAFSAWTHLFWGNLAGSMLFLVVGSIVGLFWAYPVDHLMKRIYQISGGQNRMMMLIAEGVKILIALFIPFLYFAFVGLMGGTAYQYYIRTTHGSGGKDTKNLSK